MMEKLKQKKKVLILAVTGLVVVGVLGFVSTRIFGKDGGKAGAKGEDRQIASHQSAEEDDAEDETGVSAEIPAAKHIPVAKQGLISSLFGSYGQALISVQDKVEVLSRALEENERLKMENANLRVQTEGLRFGCKSKDAENQAGKLEAKLSEETGTRVGRTLAGIEYRPPAHLLPEQLFTLGVGYFKAHEDEKAVVILSFLTGMEDDGAYKTSQNFLMTGVAWYRLDNVKLADQYFEKALNTPAAGENLQYHAQARLWRALAANKINNHTLSQNWLRELVDHHPKCTEASWVNGNLNSIKVGERLPASEHPKPHKEHHDDDQAE